MHRYHWNGSFHFSRVILFTCGYHARRESIQRLYSMHYELSCLLIWRESHCVMLLTTKWLGLSWTFKSIYCYNKRRLTHRIIWVGSFRRLIHGCVFGSHPESHVYAILVKQYMNISYHKQLNPALWSPSFTTQWYHSFRCLFVADVFL